MTVYAAMDDGLLVAEGVGGAISMTERLPDHELEAVAAHPAIPDRVFVGTFTDGLLRSTDGGHTWERVGRAVIDPDEGPETADRRGAGPDGISVMAVAVSPSDPDVVWAGTEPSAVFRSLDGGQEWEPVEGLRAVDSATEWSFPPRPYTHHVRWLAEAPADPERLYIAIEAGAFVLTTDAGGTFADRPPGSRRDNHTIATHPEAPDRVYVAAGDGYAESIDGGETWTHPMDGLAHRYVWSVGVDPGDPDRVLVAAASGAGSAHGHRHAESYVYRSGGGPERRTWNRLTDTGLPTGEGVTRAVLTGGRAPGELFAMNDRGLFRSTDGGDSFDRVGATWPDRFQSSLARGIAVV